MNLNMYVHLSQGGQDRSIFIDSFVFRSVCPTFHSVSSHFIHSSILNLIVSIFGRVFAEHFYKYSKQADKYSNCLPGFFFVSVGRFENYAVCKTRYGNSFMLMCFERQNEKNNNSSSSSAVDVDEADKQNKEEGASKKK